MKGTMVNVPPKVVLTDYTFPSIETERSFIEAAGAKFEAYQCQNREEISSAVDGANVVLVQLAKVDQDAVRKLAPGATIIRYGIGYDNIDVEAARKFGIKVAYVPDYCTDEVADHTVALMLSLVRGLYVMNATVRSGGWMNDILKLSFSPLNEMTIGLIGLGRIARAVVDRTRAFAFRHLAYDPLVSASYAERVGVELDGLHSVISQSDILSLHVPLTQETFHLINAESLRWMKPSAVLVNTARGGLVDLEALSDALCNAKIAGAALDVFEEEPLPSNHPLRREAKVILTPHVAWYSTASIARLQRLVAEEAVRAVKGQALRCPIPEM